MDVVQLRCAGQAMPDARDLVRRYCGLPWSRGGPETWAYPYFDLIPGGDPDFVEPIDVLACAALHPGLRREDLAYFDRSSGPFDQWLSNLPTDLELADADDDLVAQIADLLFLVDPVGLSMLSKVAHRKRPLLVPMFDRVVADRYRPITGERGQLAWPALVTAISEDLRDQHNRRLLDDIVREAVSELGEPTSLSALRALDIAMWMELEA